MKDLVMCSEPIIDRERRIIITDDIIDDSKEISISVNGKYIIGNDEIYEIINNEITLTDDCEIDFDSVIVVVYHKI